MIQMQTYLNVADNSGAKIVQCIKVLGGSHKNTAGIGEIIVVAVKDAIPNAPVKKGDVVKCVIVRTTKPLVRSEELMELTSDSMTMPALSWMQVSPQKAREFLDQLPEN